MPQRKYSKEQKYAAKANPRVNLPIPYDEYQEIDLDGKQFRRWLIEMIHKYPRLFPKEIVDRYTLHDILPVSTKLPDVRFRRIKLKARNEAN